jgi:SAM-dependent methyltransferase
MRFLARALEVTDGDDGSGRLAIDLGCGAGNEALALLERGWRVHAVDGEPKAIEILESRVPPEARPRLTTEIASFHKVRLPEADLVFASLSLPFAAERQNESVTRALEALKPGGWFVGVFFGARDSWASQDDIASTDPAELAALFAGFHPIHIDEEEFDGASGVGTKHWHWYVVSARKPPSDMSSEPT